MKVALTILFCFCISAIYCATLTIDGSKTERKFDGIGGLSGGGATSRFLPSYEEPYISQILDYLFKPNFAASLQILKVEIGGDCQTTEGTESSHMHNRDDLNYDRGYEWWLMTEAKQRNPDILLYGLSWGVPGWIGGGNYFTEDNINYHVKWVQGAKSVYNLDIDFIGIWNERGYTTDWIIDLRHALDSAGFSNTKIVAHDAGWDIVSELQSNSTLKSVVDVVGVHYPGCTSPSSAQALQTPLWASEDYSTYSDSTGGGCWGRILNDNYVTGYMTSTISWNLIASYYNNLPYAGDGLMWATSPWTGHYDVQSPIWVSAHTTQFTKPGWFYLAHGNGVGQLPAGGSYVTFVPPDNTKGDFTLVIQTFTHDHSVCIRPALPPFNIAAQTVTFQLSGGLATGKTLYVWYTHLEQNNSNTYFEQIKSIIPQNGQFTVDLDLDSVVTISTLTGQQKGGYPSPPPNAPFPSSYKDTFENYTLNSEANYFADQTGVWEIAQGNASKVMRQVVTIPPIVWCGESDRPISLVGQYGSAESVSVDALIEGEGSVGIGARVGGGGCGNNYGSGYFLSVDNFGNWNFSAGTKVLDHGKTTFSSNEFHNLQITTSGTAIKAYVNGDVVASVTDSTYKEGFAAIGTGWNYAQFDNFYLSS